MALVFCCDKLLIPFRENTQLLKAKVEAEIDSTIRLTAMKEFELNLITADEYRERVGLPVLKPKKRRHDREDRDVEIIEDVSEDEED